MSLPRDWLAELDAAAWCILMCPSWHDCALTNHRRERLSDAQHKSPPAISPIILCTGLPLHQQPDAEQRPWYYHSYTQLICTVWRIMSTYAKKQKTKKNISQLKGATSCSATQNMADIQEYYWANSVFVFFRQKTQCSLGWGWLISNNSYTPLEMPKLISSNYSWITDLQLYVLFSSVQGACQWGLKKIQLFDSPLACLTKVWLWRMPSAPGKHQIVNW